MSISLVDSSSCCDQKEEDPFACCKKKTTIQKDSCCETQSEKVEAVNKQSTTPDEPEEEVEIERNLLAAAVIWLKQILFSALEDILPTKDIGFQPKQSKTVLLQVFRL